MRVRCGRGGGGTATVENDDDVDDDESHAGQVGGRSTTTTTTTLEDCARVIDAVLVDFISEDNGRGGFTYGDDPSRGHNDDPRAYAALALMELALGVSSLADASFIADAVLQPTDDDEPRTSSPDVHVRVVIASDYGAIDPMFHTDKCPLRAYVTLCGPGTEYVDVACRPWEYAALRAFGIGTAAVVALDDDDDDEDEGRKYGIRPIPRVREAKEMEFIVMKGDRYVHPTRMGGELSSLLPGTPTPSGSTLWSRSSACVHRSPPGSSSSGGGGGVRRVILSLDLANGEDDREWYEAGRKREWRSGMTQRKSRLVS
jgi:hypothetical protein